MHHSSKKKKNERKKKTRNDGLFFSFWSVERHLLPTTLSSESVHSLQTPRFVQLKHTHTHIQTRVYARAQSYNLMETNLKRLHNPYVIAGASFRSNPPIVISGQSDLKYLFMCFRLETWKMLIFYW